MTETPFGIIQSWRNIGGIFDLFGWRSFQASTKGLWRCAHQRDSLLLWIVSDHFSKGNNAHRGCKGHDYDRERSEAASRKLARQFEHVFGEDKSVYVIRVTIETDEDAIIFHGADGRGVLDLASADGMSREQMSGELNKLYPRMPRTSDSRWDMLADLTELGMRNLKHIARVRSAQRPIEEAEHREWVIGVGQGFDWLYKANTALLIGPFDPDFTRAVKTAGKLVSQNVQRKDFNRERGVVLMSCAPFRPEEGGVGRRYAEMQAMSLAKEAEEALRGFREIQPHLHYLTGVVDMETCQLHVLEDK
jgi:hypothetical protein